MYKNTVIIKTITLQGKKKTPLKRTGLIWLGSYALHYWGKFCLRRRGHNATAACHPRSRIILPTSTLHNLYLIIMISVHSSYAQFLRTRNNSHLDPPLLSILRKPLSNLRNCCVGLRNCLGGLGWGFLGFF